MRHRPSIIPSSTHVAEKKTIQYTVCTPCGTIKTEYICNRTLTEALNSEIKLYEAMRLTDNDRWLRHAPRVRKNSGFAR